MNWKNFGEPSIQIGNLITNIQSSASKKSINQFQNPIFLWIDKPPLFNPVWHGTGHFYTFVLVGSDNVSCCFFKNFQTFLELKIDINRVILTHWALQKLPFGGSNVMSHSMARANLNKSKKSLDFYYHSIKVHTQEAQNLHQLKSPLSDPNLLSKSTSKCKHCETRFT